MKIDSAYVGMDSAGSATSATKIKTYAVSAGIGLAQGREPGSYTFSQLLGNAEDESVQADAKRLLLPQESSLRTGKTAASQRDVSSMDSFRRACILYLLRWIYEGLGRNSQGGGYEYFHYEEENTSFQTVGSVMTSDGRQIDFNLQLDMSRKFVEYTGIRSDDMMAALTDPLVINLDAPAAAISDQRFEFDIDTDGLKEKLPMLQAGSGFLALDKNGDGRINDGSELFGTKSGDGFSDLSAYDSDHNGWIDENDEIFNRLLIWQKDPSGRDSLYTLKECGVGALCLMKARTDFTLDTPGLTQGGRIRSTGIFLYENGAVGTMQQVDLAG
ncbi:MAG: hypothetical protein K6E84_03850 [Lachnospiraceae bacterium]|nr:hypothetical protein [Lachnospiraceae bacterium]